MKKAAIIGLGICVLSVVIICRAQSLEEPNTQVKHWQDELRTAKLYPQQQWFEDYGYGDAALLAHGAVRLSGAVQTQGRILAGFNAELEAIKKELAELKAPDTIDGNDPNE